MRRESGFMDRTLRNAFIASVFIHAAFVLPFYNHVLSKADPKKEMIVDYVMLKETVKIKKAVKDVALRIPETPKVELKPNVDAVPTPSAPSSNVEMNKDAPQELAIKQTHIKTTKDYINYYQLLREKIRQKVRRNYRSFYSEGEVCLNFVLRSDGSLVSCDPDKALSTSDSKLLGLAASSIREAAPFPPFPKALSLPRMAFSVTVVFKKD